MKLLFMVLVLAVFGLPLSMSVAQDDFVYGDPLPDAPLFAARGPFGVGVQTITIVNPDQVDILNATNDEPAPLYDRELTLEIWYPAIIPEGESERTTYEDILGRVDQPDTVIPFSFAGRALRDAQTDTSGAPYPLIVVSHGYPGSRLMLSYLTENLASKGYVVASIGHTESTFQDVGAFSSTLLHRSADQIFTIDEMERLSATDSGSFLSGLLDAQNTGLIGYSMGGYGALNTLGAGYAPILRMLAGGDAIESRLASNESLVPDARIKAAVLFAPFGGDLGFVGAPGSSFFEDEALAKIEAPTLWIAGEYDDVSIYAGIVRLFEKSIHSDRYLLTYANALHNVAPNPPPPEADTVAQYQRYSEPAWDERRINNVNQHFVTAFFDRYLKDDGEKTRYLDVKMEDGHTFATSSTIWPGFAPRNVLGLSMRHVTAG